MSGEKPLVQWVFLQYKKAGYKGPETVKCFAHSSTQIGSKILIYGGCSYTADPQDQLVLYDTVDFQWSFPAHSTEFQEDNPGARYSHTATLVGLHPPKIMVYGGIVGAGTFEFESPDSLDDPPEFQRSFMSWRRKGKKSVQVDETDDAVYFLELNAEKWVWKKPLLPGSRGNRPPARSDHSASKIGTNEVAIFGGLAERPMNDLWVFDISTLEWRRVIPSGIQPGPRYRHTSEYVKGKLYIMGGSDNSDDIAERCSGLGFHVLDLETNHWHTPILQGESPFPRSGHSSAVIGARSIAIFGGKRNGELLLNDLCLIDTETLTVTYVNAVESLRPTPIANASLTVIGNKCFVFGGTDVKGACYNDVRSLDVAEYLNSNDISVGEGAASDYSFKIIVIGDASVGKSSLLTRFTENTFLENYAPTIGIDYSSRMIRVDRAICKLEIWDTAGQERFSVMTASYYRGAQGALLVYDVGSRASFEHVHSWYQRAKQLGGEDMEVVLVGNKCDLIDLEREVTTDEGQSLAADLDVNFVEVSALKGDNVERAFVTMTGAIKRSVDRRGLTGVKLDKLKKSGTVTLATGDQKPKLSQRCGCSF